MDDRSYFLAIPASLANLDIPSSHKMVAGSIFTRTYLRDKGGFIAIRARYFMEDWGLQETAITASLKWLKENGVIETKRTRYGTLIRWVRSDVDESFGDELNHNENEDPEKQGSRKTGIENPEKRGLRTPKNGDALIPYTGFPKSKTKTEEKKREETSITENQSTRASAVLPVAPPLCLSGRLLGMINAAFPSNPNAVLHQIRMSGWDERRVEAGLLKTDPRKGVSYFASICRRMTDEEVEAMFAVPESVPDAPKRIMSKDGRKVLINGEWLEAATPYPNLPAPTTPLPADHDPRLAEIYFLFWEEVNESITPKIEKKRYWRIWQELSDTGYEYKKGRMTADELKRKSEAILIDAGHPYTRKEGK